MLTIGQATTVAPTSAPSGPAPAPSGGTPTVLAKFTCTTKSCTALDLGTLGLFKIFQSILNLAIRPPICTTTFQVNTCQVNTNITPIKVDGVIGPPTLVLYSQIAPNIKAGTIQLLPTSTNRNPGGFTTAFRLPKTSAPFTYSTLATNAEAFSRIILGWLGLTWVEKPGVPGHYERLGRGKVAKLPPLRGKYPSGTLVTQGANGRCRIALLVGSGFGRWFGAAATHSEVESGDNPPANSQQVDEATFNSKTSSTSEPASPPVSPGSPTPESTPPSTPPPSTPPAQEPARVDVGPTAVPGSEPTAPTDLVTLPPASDAVVLPSKALPEPGKPKFFRLNNPLMWVVLVGAAGAIGTGGYLLVRHKAS